MGTGPPEVRMDISSEKKPALQKKSLLQDLLSDIEPFFYRSAFMYVDAGAHRGDIFREIETSALKPKRSYLIEPNPRSFAALRETVRGLGADRRVSCLNVALSDAPGMLRLSDEDDMSRVLDAPDGGFEVEAVRLDDLAETFETDRVSLLKIDVEGHEPRLLAGAERLLRDQRIDMIYVEAGLNPDGGQQTYYRAIEDLLRGHGYRLFRIYEQKNEWIEDSPLLRRMNMAFMSGRFAEANPQRLSRELFDLRAVHADLGKRLSERDRAAETAERRALDLEARLSERDRAAETAERRALDLEARLSERDRAAETARAEMADLKRRIGEADRDRKKAEDALRALRGEVAESRAELAKLRRYGRVLEGKYADILDSTTWRAMEPARRIMRGIRGRRAPAPFVPKLSGGGSVRAGNATSENVSFTPGREEVDRYVHHLWAGLSAPAVKELERVLEDDRYDQDSRFTAAHKLATWHAYAGDLDSALSTIRSIDRVAPKHRLSPHRLIKEGFIQLKRGDRDAARQLFERLLRRKGRSRARDGILALSNCLTEDSARLAQINRVYDGTKFRGLTLRDPYRPLTLDNVTGLPDTCETPGSGKISVIVPAYNAQDTIGTALRSLTEQTWRDLEIIVVDDCSTDATHSIVSEMAAADPRIVPLRAERNGGPYAARNLALDVATGEFITTHDSDDWSHPKKIELQVAYLAKNQAVMGVCTCWVRVYADFSISSNWRIGDQTVHWSHSSFLFRRAVLERIGGWDPVRVGGDTEYIWRMRSVYGEGSFKVVGQGVPMAFARDEESSLTRAKPTHVRTIRFGLRQIYRAVAEYSHARPGGAGPEGARLRREAAPAEMFATPEGPADLDFLLMGDCASPSIVAEMRDFIESPEGRGRKIGLFHWPDFDSLPTAPRWPGDDLCMEYCELLTREGVSPVLPGARIRLATRFGAFYGTGHQEIDRMPQILVSDPDMPCGDGSVFSMSQLL
jgi:FkbM family methyltransferase